MKFFTLVQEHHEDLARIIVRRISWLSVIDVHVL